MYLIRVASNISFGKGHISRCIRIRKAIKNKVIWFIDKGTKELFFDSIKDEVIEENSTDSCSKLAKLAFNFNIKAIIIDSPAVKSFNIKKITFFKPVVILVDEYFKQKNTLSICMHPINTDDNNFISGFKYFPILKKNKKKNKKKNILISFGNKDSNNITEKIIKALQSLFSRNQLKGESYIINVVLGQFNQNISSISKMIFADKKFKIYKALSNLDPLYKKSDFAIGAPGFSQIERIEYNIPSILVAQNKIQKNLLAYWEESGCAIVAKNLDADLKYKIVSLLTSKKNQNSIKNKIISSFDNQGAVRIIKEIENFSDCFVTKNLNKIHN